LMTAHTHTPQYRRRWQADPTPTTIISYLNSQFCSQGLERGKRGNDDRFWSSPKSFY
jgi:hypothetical protein